MIQDKIFFDEKDPTGLSYNTPFTFYGSYQGRLWSKAPGGEIKYYTQNSDLSIYATTGSNQFSGSQTITGSLTVTGQVVAQTLNVQQVTSSIVYSSGSNIFGNSLANTQQFTGSVGITGSLTVAGAGTFSNTLTLNGSNNVIRSGNELRFNRADNAIYTRLYDAGSLAANGFILDNVNGEGFHFQNNGTTIIRMNSSGNVGIGTTSPTKQLVLAANNNAVSENNTLQFWDTDTTTEANQQIGKIEFYSSDASSPGAGVKAYIGAFAQDTTPDAYIAFATQDGSGTPNPVERLRISSEGNVGIGTTSPGATLNIRSLNSLNSDTLAQVITRSELKIQYRLDDLSSMYFGGLGSERGYIQGVNNAENAGADISINPYGGNVGIGTNSPNQLLHLYTNLATSSGVGTAMQITSDGSGGDNAWIGVNKGAGNGLEFSVENRDIIFNTGATTPFGGSERMRITSGGSILVGATAGRGGGSTGHLFKQPSGDVYFELMANTSTSQNDILFSPASTGAYGIVGYDHSDNSMRFFANSAERLRITSDGDLILGRTNYDPKFYMTSTGGNGINERFYIDGYADGGGSGYGGGFRLYTRDTVNVFHQRLSVDSSGIATFSNQANFSGDIQLNSTFGTIKTSANNSALVLLANPSLVDNETRVELVGRTYPSVGNSIYYRANSHIFTRSNASLGEVMSITSNGNVLIPNQPAWSVGLSGQQGFNTNVASTINWNQSSGNDCFIQGGVTLNGTNGRVTVPVAGKYMVFASIRTEATGAATGTNLNLRRNGTTIVRHWVGTAVNSAGSFMYIEPRPVIINCAANDYIDFQFDSVTNDFVLSAVTNTVVRFGGYLVG